MILNADGLPLGCIDLFDFDPVNMRVGVGVLIDPQFRGKRLRKGRDCSGDEVLRRGTKGAPAVCRGIRK